MSKELKYKRILLKLSGESLMGEKGHGIDPNMLEFFAAEIKKIHSLKCQVGIVIGGGNIYRGLSAGEQGIDRVTGKGAGLLKLPDDSDDLLFQAEKFCPLCGRFITGNFIPHNLREPVTEEKYSSTWKEIYATWEKKQPELVRYGMTDSLSDISEKSSRQ